MSQPNQQRIIIHMLPNISQSKGNQTMKFGLLIEYNKRNVFLQKSCTKNEAGRLVPNHILFFKKALYEVKATCNLQFSFNIFL